ncbi:MAG: hypothetical protein H0T99_09645, partial [Geodermatophilaceae bacterium]|nr:hypothetical protein [Geodermatophilaceae bacterium]
MPQQGIGPSRWTPIALIAGLVAVGLAVALPLAPVNMSMPSVTWPQDTTSPQSTSLQLVSQTPRGLEIRFSCETARAAEGTSDGVLLATINPDQPVVPEQGLVISVLDGRVQIDAVGEGLVDERLSDGACGYRILGDSAGLMVSRDGTDIASTAALPDIDVLATSLTDLPGAGPDDLSVRVLVDNQMASSP